MNELEKAQLAVEQANQAVLEASETIQKLVAENAALNGAIERVSGVYKLSPHIQKLCEIKTPNTDAAIAEIESVGAEKMFKLVEPAVRNFCNPVVTGFVIEELESLAANLRAGRKG